VDPVNGSDSNPGTSWEAPLKTLKAGLDKCTADEHDAVLFLSGDTADNPAAALTWNKDYTHLIGLSSGVYGLGQRCRVVALAATAISPVITFSSNGCIIKNMQFYNEKASGAASGVAIVTGSRNYFENVFFMCPVANDANSYSLKMSGSENLFVRCTIGQLTNARTGASFGLWMHGAGAVSRNKFVQCEFLAWSVNVSTAHEFVRIDVDIVTSPWMTEFEDCLFDNFPEGGAAGGLLAEAINDNCTTWHQVLLRGQNDFVGVSAVGSTLTHIFHAEKGTGTQSGLLMAAVNES
jgi:hypothetical protein